MVSQLCHGQNEIRNGNEEVDEFGEIKLTRLAPKVLGQM